MSPSQSTYGCVPFEKQPWEMTKEEFLKRLDGHIYPSAKDGYTVLYHVTTRDKAQAIACEGLKTAKASGIEGPPGALFATSEPEKYSTGGTLIAFQYPDDWAREAGPPWSKLIWADVPVEDILAIYPDEFNPLYGQIRLDMLLKYLKDSGYGETVYDELLEWASKQHEE